MRIEFVSTVAEAAMAPAIIFPWVHKLLIFASIKPSRNWLRYKMPVTRTARAAIFNITMRRVRLEKAIV